MEFDVDATFGDDYLYFYAESTDEGHSDDDAAEILGRLDLPPGSRVLDAPCGHGRISRRLATAGLCVTGVDLSARFIAMAQAGAAGPAGRQNFVRGDLRHLPVRGPFDAVVCWFTSFGYHDDDDCRRVLAEFHRVLRPRRQVADRDHAARRRRPAFHGGAGRHRGLERRQCAGRRVTVRPRDGSHRH